MDDLAERIEAAEGPSRELDAEISDAVWRAKWGRKKPKDIAVDPFTASLDAAMMLVPEGCFYGFLRHGDGKRFIAICQAEGPDLRWRNAATPALALCAAALRARAGE